MNDTIRVERMPGAWPVLASILVGSFAFVSIGAGVVFFTGVFDLKSFEAKVCIEVIVTGPLTYLLTRGAYMEMRWKKIYDSDGRYCTNCTYDLTGNVSGRCPECGLEVVGAVPPQVAQKD